MRESNINYPSENKDYEQEEVEDEMKIQNVDSEAEKDKENSSDFLSVNKLQTQLK